MDFPNCEICGEADVSVQTLDVGMCDDCAEQHIREALAPLFGHVCASLCRRRNGFLTTCLAPAGVEHLHD